MCRRPLSVSVCRRVSPVAFRVMNIIIGRQSIMPAVTISHDTRSPCVPEGQAKN